MDAQLNIDPWRRTPLSRRTVLRRAAALLGATALAPALSACDIPLVSSSSSEPMEMPVETPEEALTRLVEGNLRFASGGSKPIHESADRRANVVERQRPFATIFSCVDSRVPPELIFDRGLGDLLVIRTAGNVIDSAVMGSLEYGAYELEIPLLLVLGHGSCGAVKAAAEAVKNDAKREGSIAFLVEALRPAITPMKPEALALIAEPVGSAADQATSAQVTPDPLDPATDTATAETAATAETLPPSDTEAKAEDDAGTDPLTAAIKRNVMLTVKAVSESAIIAERIRKDRLRVVGAFYDLGPGSSN